MPRKVTFTLAALLALGLVSAGVAQEAPATLRFGTLTTAQGERYEQAQVLKVEVGGVTVMHARGTTQVAISDLPADVLNQLVGILPPKTGESKREHDAMVWKQRMAYYEGMRRSTIRTFVLVQKLPNRGYLAQEILGDSSQEPEGETRRLVYLRPDSDVGVVIPKDLIDPRTHEIELQVADAGPHLLATGQEIPSYFVY